jgi:hypothetical protein
MRQQAMARYRRKRGKPRAHKFPDGINPMGNIGAVPPNPQRRSDGSIVETRRTGSRSAANPIATRYRVDKGGRVKMCHLSRELTREPGPLTSAIALATGGGDLVTGSCNQF